ncbi:MAG: hypothetical protein Kow0029_08290 [Candidatus Rifleibacteriota bacterium]
MLSDKLNRTFRSRSGSIIVLTVFAAVFLLGMTALVTDVGYMYYNQAKLQTAINAGWKAGYDRMMQLKDDGILTQDEQDQVIQHVKEVMIQNGYSEDQLQNLKVTFGADNRLDVSCTQSVGLFFARVMNFNSANIGAERVNHALDFGQGIVPLAIPHGVTKDLAKNVYSCDLFAPSDSGNGIPGVNEFASGTEYILKLGSGGGNGTPGTPVEVGKILVPMDSGSQSSSGFLRAYGAAFWCLKIDDADPGFVPVEWLLGYRGGSFLLPNADDVKSILNNYGVNYIEITDPDQLQAIYDSVNPNVLELYNRPRIAVYSSQGDPDPVEVVLRAAYIPYGEYSQPNNWPRNRSYRSNNNTVIYDGEILAHALDNYEWLHLHHEDFTGFCGGCQYFMDSCKDALDAGLLGSDMNQARDKMCSYCRSKFSVQRKKVKKRWQWVASWASDYNPESSTLGSNCKNTRRRCMEKVDYNGNLWTTLSGVPICGTGNVNYPQCSLDAKLQTIAANNGFVSDAGSSPKPQWPVDGNGNNPIPDNLDGFFNKATSVQKMKWQVVKLIKQHVEQGGFLFAQCFAPETFDLALWQSAIYDGASPEQAYSNCVAFENFHYKAFPRRYGRTYYSDINTREGSGNFNLLAPLDPRCQNHGSGYCCYTGQGHTASFVASKLKPGTTVLGYQQGTGNAWVKYLKGKVGNGDFTFLGGHYHYNTETRRLVLNNILLGSLVEKNVGSGSGGTTYAGKQKSNYGVIDPDNYVGGGANDYRDRFMYGFNSPIELGDRIITEPGNMRGPTDQAVDFRVNGDGNIAPNRYVIVPITDVPPEVPQNNPQNANAKTIYDLQGTDHPNGVYDPAKYGFGSSVRVIGFAMFKILDPSEYTRAGENYAPGDSGDLGPYQPGQVRGIFIKYIVKPGEVTVN